MNHMPVLTRVRVQDSELPEQKDQKSKKHLDSPQNNQSPAGGASPNSCMIQVIQSENQQDFGATDRCWKIHSDVHTGIFPSMKKIVV